MMSTAHTDRPPPKCIALRWGTASVLFKCVATVCDGYMLEGVEVAKP